MTMIFGFTWQDKAIIMADSREHARGEKGEITNYNDHVEKITPIFNQLAIAHAGLGKVLIGKDHYFDMKRVTEHFLKENQKVLMLVSSDQLLKGLVEMWNRTLSEKLNRDPFSIKNRYSLMLARFETKNGKRIPRIHSYQSHLKDFNYNGTKAVVGDDECYPIIKPYYNTDTEGWTLEQVLEYYLKGFSEVMDTVKTIGGPVDIYVLEDVSKNSYWLRRKIVE